MPKPAAYIPYSIKKQSNLLRRAVAVYPAIASPRKALEPCLGRRASHALVRPCRQEDVPASEDPRAIRS